MEGYTRKLSKLYLLNPANTFYTGRYNTTAWQKVDNNGEFTYHYSPSIQGEWTCNVSYSPERYAFKIDGDVQVTILIKPSDGPYYTFYSSGTIKENNGYQTTIDGAVSGGNGKPWVGTFRVETSLNGKPMDWGVLYFDGSDEPDCLTGHRAYNLAPAAP